MKKKHPMQPVVMVGKVARFKKNAIVDFLLEWATARGCSMNTLAMMEFSREDREQFAQLIGYSVDGAADLSYVSKDLIRRADFEISLLLRKKR